MSAHQGTIRELELTVDRICGALQEGWEKEKAQLEALANDLREAQYNAHKAMQIVREAAADLDSIGPCEAIAYRDGYGPDNYTDYECGDSAPLIRCADGEYRYICSTHQKEWK